jgi:hypothetical protein
MMPPITFIWSTVIFVNMWAVVDGGLEADALDVVVGEDWRDESKGRTYCRIKSAEESELLANNIGLKSCQKYILGLIHTRHFEKNILSQWISIGQGKLLTNHKSRYSMFC